jgi:hypothetical protein
VVDLLGAIAARDDAPAHLLHQLGVALLWCDRHGEARVLLERAAATSDCGCDLGDALILAGDAGEPAEADETSLAVLIVEGCREADAALAEGDPERVIARLHRAPVLGGHDVQGRARLVAAHLAVPARDAIGRMQKALALAAFVADQTGRRPRVSELPLVRRWSQARIDAIARAAARWLEEVYAGAGEDRGIVIDETPPAA